MVAVLLEDSRYFSIEERLFEFDDKDPIFCIDKPTLRKEHLAEKGVCTCCNAQFKSVKAVSYCEFCGGPVCGNCLTKKRPLPGTEEHQLKL
jgi:hypothetical protein